MVLRALFVLTLMLLPASADAVTIRDIIALTKAGLPDDVLTALIDADRTIFTLDADQIIELRTAGVTEPVLLKMLRSRQEYEPKPQPAPDVAADAPLPQVVVIGGAPDPPAVTVIVPQYFYIPVPIWGRPVHAARDSGPFLAPAHRGFGRFINDGWLRP